MCAVFEIEILTERYSGYQWIEQIASVLGVKTQSFEMFLGDDWTFEKETRCDNLRDINTDLQEGKIVRLDCTNTDVNCGLYICQEKELIHYSIWCECAYSELDKDCIDQSNRSLYESLYAVIYDLINRKVLANCVLIAMGAELFFEVIYPLEQTVLRAKNVCAWIIGQSSFDIALTSFSDFILRDDSSAPRIYEKIPLD